MLALFRGKCYNLQDAHGEGVYVSFTHFLEYR